MTEIIDSKGNILESVCSRGVKRNLVRGDETQEGANIVEISIVCNVLTLQGGGEGGVKKGPGSLLSLTLSALKILVA